MTALEQLIRLVMTAGACEQCRCIGAVYKWFEDETVRFICQNCFRTKMGLPADRHAEAFGGAGRQNTKHMNKVFLIGTIANTPELTRTSRGATLCKLTIAVNGVDGHDAELFNVITWNTLAERCAKLLTRGRLVFVEGTLNKRTWRTKDGKTNSSVSIIASIVQFLSDKKEETQCHLQKNQ